MLNDIELLHQNPFTKTLYLTFPYYLFWRRKWQPTLVLLPGKFHGLRSLIDYSPRGRRVGHD